MLKLFWGYSKPFHNDYSSETSVIYAVLDMETLTNQAATISPLSKSVIKVVLVMRVTIPLVNPYRTSDYRIQIWLFDIPNCYVNQ